MHGCGWELAEVRRRLRRRRGGTSPPSWLEVRPGEPARLALGPLAHQRPARATWVQVRAPLAVQPLAAPAADEGAAVAADLHAKASTLAVDARADKAHLGGVNIDPPQSCFTADPGTAAARHTVPSACRSVTEPSSSPPLHVPCTVPPPGSEKTPRPHFVRRRL